MRKIKDRLYDAWILLVLLGLGLLQFGWIFWPSVGTAWNFINGGVITGIMAIGLIYLIFGTIKKENNQ